MMEDLTGDDDDDAEMEVLTPNDITEPDQDPGDEVENLQNSLRKVIHDDNVRPKLQCLVMDTSFSMVTMQGEDSGIAWVTTPSCCSTSWAPEAGEPTKELGPQAPASACVTGSNPAGRIIFVMDEELLSGRKKTKRERQKKERIDISERPELVSVAPLIKKDEGAEAEQEVPGKDKEQRLFSLVSEGSEILNIVVPQKLATVDEEKSKGMVHNLSYLEECSSSKPAGDKEEETCEQDSEPKADASVGSGEQVHPTQPVGSSVTDPPGAPVARPPGMEAFCDVEYLEAFSLTDDHAPGSPAVVPPEPGVPEHKTTTEKPVQFEDTATGGDDKKTDAIGPGALNAELLDELFYRSTDDYLMRRHMEREDELGGIKPSAPPSKPNGLTLFGSQEDVLTPVFLPEGPPKIIDPVLLEEPKTIGFLYDNLYGEATGSRKREDTESGAFEKSFYSRHLYREARGYLEKYALIDETPVVEVQPVPVEECEGCPLLSQDFADFPSTLLQGEMPNSEEKITNFFRSSASSSPCDIKAVLILQENDSPSTTKSITETGAKDPRIHQNPLSVFETSSEPDWQGMDDDNITSHIDSLVHFNQQTWLQESEVVKPCPPPRRKTRSPLKERLVLAPLTPADDSDAGKEQKEEKTEAAVSGETGNEGRRDRELQIPSDVPLLGNASTNDVSGEKPAEKEDTEVALTQTEPEASESEKVHLETQNHLTTSPNKPAKTTCLIL